MTPTWDDWYEGLVDLADKHVVVIMPGTVGDEPVTCWLAQPLDREARRMARSKDGRVRAALAFGVLKAFQKQCAQHGMKPPAPLI